MLTKLKALREEREEGFTLIELLVVILIIGILAAIAIPVFLNQRMTANDGAVESDVRNAASQVETWIVAQKGKDTKLTGTGAVAQDLADAIKDIKASTGVSLAISGSANNYCIIGAHNNGKNYLKATGGLPQLQNGTNKALNYDSATGGISKVCSGTAAATGTFPTTWNIVSAA